MARFSRFVATAALSASVLGVCSSGASAAGPAYVVKPGDSLFGIAAKLHVGLDSLLAANGLVVTSTILPGQQLQVPDGAAGAPASQGASPATAATYTVLAGDSLSRIASRHQVTLGALLKANAMTATSLIVPGQTISLPAGAVATPAASSATTVASSGAAATGSYTVQVGDSLSRIASRHQVTLGALLRANAMTATSLILPGQTISLPAGAVAPAAGATSSSSSSPSSSSSSGTIAVASTGTGVDAVIAYALAQQGKEYQFFSAGPERFDCSGLTKAAYAQIGITLIHQSGKQALQGAAVDFANEPIRPGDLVFLITRGHTTINHVGIAISATQYVHAPAQGQTVRVGDIPMGSVVAVRRLV